ncbi:MAG: glycosyltransferase [Proteobacteria bacterium]|nr:glycosyltransferase [Pseudomonadota bacterium]
MKIIHFHPDTCMALKFVAPLMDAELGAGHQTELVSSKRWLGKENVIIPFDLSVSNLLGLPLVLLRIRSHLKRHRPDVVFSHNTKSSLLPLLGAWLVGVHKRVYFNHGVPFVGYHGIYRWALRLMERCNVGLATHVLTVSSDMQELLKDINPRFRPQVIKHGSACGIDLSPVVCERFSRTDWRQTHGLREEDLVVLFAGRPEKRKGFEIVLRIWVDYFYDKQIKLVLCGPVSNDVLKYLDSIPSNVICLGFVDNLAEVLAGCDLLILPSLHEGLSYVCIEAQVAGTLVIANNIIGMRCLIEDGITGFLVENNNIMQYVEIILKIHKKITSTEAIRRQAKENVARFSREHFIPAYLSFLSGLLRE